MNSSHPTTSDHSPDADAQQRAGDVEVVSKPNGGYQWTALSVTTVGALLASIQGSALLIALPNILTDLRVTFFTLIV